MQTDDPKLRPEASASAVPPLPQVDFPEAGESFEYMGTPSRRQQTTEKIGAPLDLGICTVHFKWGVLKKHFADARRANVDKNLLLALRET